MNTRLSDLEQLVSEIKKFRPDCKVAIDYLNKVIDKLKYEDTKIEDAAKQHSEESYISDYFQACYKDAFMECAKWMQEEFLKDLWHPVSEEPKKGRVFLYKTIFKGYGLNKIIDGNEWKYIIKYKKATQWLYIDDLLPKKGD